MNLQISTRIRPFSHLPGTMCLLPQTHLLVQVFPARIHFFDPVNTLLDLRIKGPVEGFTVEMDLEKLCIRVFGISQEGYFRYLLQRRADGIVLIADKVPQGGLFCYLLADDKTHLLLRKETLLIPWAFTEDVSFLSSERLSLGMHKRQDWDLVRRRLDFKEIFPIWMRLAQLTPPHSLPTAKVGNVGLLRTCREMIEQKLKVAVLSAFRSLFLASFKGILVPRLFDTDFQGIVHSEETSSQEDILALSLLLQGALLIRSLFLEEKEGLLHLLPCLPPDFHAGRFIGAHTTSGGISFEWTKKQVRRIAFYPSSDKKIGLQLSRDLKRCRVRLSEKDQGKEQHLKEGKLFLSGNGPFLIDRFQK